jgi:putative addiction module component (TIGR02574 family)
MMADGALARMLNTWCECHRRRTEPSACARQTRTVPGCGVAPTGYHGSFPWYPPLMSTEELLAQVLRLPRPDRARLAEELLSSLEEADEEVAAAWAPELERHSREVAEGKVQTVDWGTARAEILKELEERRAL